MLRRAVGGSRARLPSPTPIRLVREDGTVLYTSDAEDGPKPYPTPDEVLRLVAEADDPSCKLLRECARQVFSSGPFDKLGEWGNHMLTTAPGQAPDVTSLQTLHLTNRRGVCGYTFKKGDICWNCRTCQVDPTCVQCDACFKNSDHTGHEVFFHASSPGGCCDCGDLEAWKQAGCCKAHSGADPTADPSDNLSPSMRVAATVVFEEAIRVVKDAFCHAVQCYNVANEHRFYRVPGSHSIMCCIRLHNDDIHTYPEVTEALTQIDLSEPHANEQTKRVDEDGQAHVKAGFPADLRAAYERVADKGLLVSLVDEAQVYREIRAEKILSWLSELCQRVDGLARLVSMILISPLNLSTPAHPSYEEGTRWNTPALRLHQPSPHGGLAVSSQDASLPLTGPSGSFSLLALLMVTDFFLIKKMRQEFHELLLYLLVDSTLKPALAKELTTVYPLLNGLYTRGIGTGEDSIFSFSVQLYTTPSLVRWLAFRTEGEEQMGTRGLITILTESLLQSFRIAGWQQGQVLPAHFWDHHFIVHRRFQHVLKDLDYTLQTTGTAWAMREGTYPGPGPKPLANWIALLTSLQLADTVERKTGAHLEYESTTWMQAFSLALPLTSTCSIIIMQGLQPDDEEAETPAPDVLTEAVGSLSCKVAQAMQRWVSTLQEWQFDVNPVAMARGGEAGSPPLLRFHVHRQSVSYHLPLHRFLVSVVLEGLSRGAMLPPTLSLKDPERFAVILAEFPIRCLALSAQVMAGLWRRNGLAIHRQAVHYCGVPFCRVFRDLDLGALQLATLYLGFDPLLTLLLDRFSVLHWASTTQPPVVEGEGEPFDGKVHALMAEDLLLLLLHVVTELPRPPGREHRDAGLRRELVHRLACQECSHSEVHQVSSIVDDSTIGEKGFDKVLKAVSTERLSGEGHKRFDLKPEAVVEYDVAFFHLGKQEHETAQERILQKRLLLPREGRARPCVAAPPPAHPAVAAVRNLLYWPQVLMLQHTILSRTLHRAADVEASPVLLSRVIHLLTLQLHCLESCRAIEEEARRLEPPSLRGYQLCESNPVTNFLVGLTSPMPTTEGGVSILELLAAIARLPPESTHLGRLYEEGLKWVLDEIASVHVERVPLALRTKGILDGYGDAGEHDKGEHTCEEETQAKLKCEKAKAAQAAAMANIREMGNRFLAGTDIKDQDDTELPPDSLECGAAACLYCHERTNSPLGYIGFVQKSTALAEALERAPSHTGIRTRYRVSHKECRVRAGAALDSAEVGMLKKGDQAVVEEKCGRRLRISWPMNGWVSEFTADRARILEPMSRYCWQTWGRVRLYTTLCGHAVHHDCWDAFYASVLQQMSNEDRYDGQYALDISRREFVCPLCKTLSNILVPHLPEHYSPPPTPTPPSASTSVPHLMTWLLSDVTSAPSPVGSSSLLAAVMYPQVVSSPRPDLPGPLLRAVRRFTDSLLEVCDVSYSRLIVGTEAERHGRRQLLRTIYTAWTSLAYAVMLDVVTDGVSNGERMSHLCILARAVREIQALMSSPDSEGNLSDLVYRPLSALLRGECRTELPDTPAASVRASALKRFPLGLVLDHEVHGPAGQNLGIPLQCMNVLHRDRVEAGELPPLEAWPMVDKPLLSWDLATLAAAVLTTTRHGADLVRAAKVLALARLAQAMLEPWTPPCGPAAELSDPGPDLSVSPGSRMDVDAIPSAAAASGGPAPDGPQASGLHMLRAALYRGLQAPVPAARPDLEATLHARWRPYLCALLTLLHLLGGLVLQEGDLYGEVQDLVQLLGLPTSFGREEAGAIALVFERWGTQYRVAQEDMAWKEGPSEGAKGGAAASSDGEWVVVDGKEERASGEEARGGVLSSAPSAQQDAAQPTAKKELGPLVYHCSPYLASVDGASVLPDSDGRRIPPTLPRVTQSGLSTSLYDLSHLGVSDDVSVGLIELPGHYTELYALLKEKYWSMNARRATSRSGSGGGQALEDPAICLMCGSVMAAGPRSSLRTGGQNIGECTAHARHCGAGQGIFLLVNKGSMVLMRDSRAAFYPSVYVDQYGEEDPHLRRGRPLFLSRQRFDRLQQMFRQHGAGKEVARVRATAERVIRENYY